MKVFSIVMLLSLQLSIYACSKKDSANSTPPRIAASDAIKIVLNSNFGFVNCFPNETFELEGFGLSYKRIMSDDNCELKSVDSTKTLTAEQKTMLVIEIENLGFTTWDGTCGSDYATQKIDIYHPKSVSTYHVYLCKQGYYVKYEDFKLLLETMQKLAI